MSPAGPSAPSLVRVLVVSSDPVVARSLVGLLQSLGLAVRCGQPVDLEAGADLALADILVFETARLADEERALVERVRERSPMVEIVVVSSDQGVDRTVQALRSGVYAVLPSPATREQLATAIVGAYGRKCHGEQRMRAISVERSPHR